MTQALFRLPVRPVAAALLLAAGLFGTGGRAEAGCGDYLLIDGRPVADHPTEPDRSPAEPCHGPNCSARQAPTPVPPAAPASPFPAPKDRAVGGVTIAPAAVGFDAPAAPLSGRPVRLSFPPFHPPRSV